MSWDEIVGHEQNIFVLQRLLEKDKIPHALLFQGADQIGKTRVGKTFAESILCSQPAHRPCGVCRSCLGMKEHAHPDFIVIRPDGQYIKIDQIRELQYQAGISAHWGGKRVCIIEEADRMNEQAANSLLKLLEEPPLGLLLLLISAKPHALLPTILSRCSVLKFQPVSIEQLTEALVASGHPQTQAKVAAQLSGGRMGAALDLLLPDGFGLRDKAVEILKSMTMSKLKIWEIAVEIDQYEQEQVLQLLHFFLLVLRDAMIYKTCGKLERVYNIDITQEIRGLAQPPAENIVKAVTKVQEAQQAIQGKANVRLTIEAMLLQLMDLVRREEFANSSGSPF